MDSLAFLYYLQSAPGYAGQIVHTEPIPARNPTYGKLDRPLSDALQERLEKCGLSRLYTHQAQAINKAREGKNVVVATSSASGKSLCYNIATLEAILSEKRSRALYLFPTKALAQDQLRALREIAWPGILQPAEVATFDGDTPQSERAEIKKSARVILSNPDMLHHGILPNHQY